MTRLALAVALVTAGCATTPDCTPSSPPGVKRGSTLAGTGHPAAARRHPSGVSRSRQRRPVTLLTVTAYCYTGSRNAAGKWPTLGTAAANAYPLGTRLHVATVGDVVVEDRSAPGATDVDLYLGGPDCAASAAAFGRRVLPVWRLAN